MRVQWKTAINTAEGIARDKRGKRSLPLRTAAETTRRGTTAGETRDNCCTPEIDSQQRAFAQLVEAPFLRLLWGVHGTTAGLSVTAAAAAAAAEDASSAEVEPSELKYLGASLRQVLAGGGAAGRVRGGEVRC